MTEEEANISQVIEDACGCPLRELPDDSEWWEVYDELINEQNDSETRSQKALRESMMLEREVDGEIQRVKDIEQDKINQKLFK